MKRLLALLTLLAAVLSLHAAPPFTMALGATYCRATEYGQNGAGMKLQVGLSKKLRVEPEILYFAQKKDVTTLNLNFNVHYLFPLVEGLALYPFVGPSYTHWGYEGPNASRWGANVGCGAELSVGSRFGVFAEARLQLVSHETQPIMGIGLKYRFK